MILLFLNATTVLNFKMNCLFVRFIVKLPKNENSVITYSPSCRSKFIRLWLIFVTQIEIFLMKSVRFLSFH